MVSCSTCRCAYLETVLFPTRSSPHKANGSRGRFLPPRRSRDESTIDSATHRGPVAGGFYLHNGPMTVHDESTTLSATHRRPVIDPSGTGRGRFYPPRRVHDEFTMLSSTHHRPIIDPSSTRRGLVVDGFTLHDGSRNGFHHRSWTHCGPVVDGLHPPRQSHDGFHDGRRRFPRPSWQGGFLLVKWKSRTVLTSTTVP